MSDYNSKFDERNHSSNEFKKTVSFADVVIRSYQYDLGDHPDCRRGPPLSSKYVHFRFDKIDLDTYEQDRGIRRDLPQLVMPAHERKRMLLSQGVDLQEMKRAVNGCKRIKKQRKETHVMLPYMKYEEAYESLKRKANRLFKSRNRSN